MPLSAPAPRRHFHTRAIEAQGFRRDDKMWDIEAHIRDTKAYQYEEHYRGVMPPGRPVHEMSLRLTLDDELIVRAVEAVTEHAPYGPCHEVAPNFQTLLGLKVGNGWRKEVRRRLGGTKGCTHLVELLDVMATVTFQTVAGGDDPAKRNPSRHWNAEGKPPFFLNGCHAWSRSGVVVRDQLPQYYEPPAPAETEKA
jgi:hypothetical protein